MRTGDGVWRALQAARRANLSQAGLPDPRPGHWGTTRRIVLKALAGAGAAGMAGTPAFGARRPGTVAIVGGGLAGLSALHYLCAAGVDARLYEARRRIGGRVHTVTVDGVTFERGGQLVNTDHADMHALTKAFGVTLVDRKAEPHRTMIVADGRIVPPDELAQGLRAIAGQIDRDARRLDADYARVAPEIDRLSMAQYLDRHAALISAPWVRRLLEATSRTEYGVEPTQSSAIELIFNLPVVEGARVEVLGGSDERFVMAGGSASLTGALADRYRDRIQTGRRIARIATARDGQIALSFLDGSAAIADRVIVAVPASLTDTIDFAVLLPAQWRAFIRVMQLGRCEKWQWAMAETPWRATLGAGGEGWSAEADAPAALVWDGTVRGGAGPETPVWNWFFGGAQVPAGNDTPPDPARLAAAFAPIAAGLDRARVAAMTANRTAWHRDPLTLGAYSNFPPGQLSRFAGLLSVDSDTPAERQYSSAGRILFAGEHLSDAYPGYMNGAAQTGRMAAEAILGQRLLKLAA